MKFREDVFSKIITYITVAVLLAAMLTEAFFLSDERKERKATEAQLSVSRENAASLQEEKQQLAAENTDLQKYKESWENDVLLEETEALRIIRADLSKRPELIPQKAVNDCRKAIAAQKEADSEAVSSTEIDNTADEDQPISEERGAQEDSALAFSFPASVNKQWLIPLAADSGFSQQQGQLYYAVAWDITRNYAIKLLYEIPADPKTGIAQRNEDGKLVWNCMAYDAGLGWTHMITEKKSEE